MAEIRKTSTKSFFLTTKRDTDLYNNLLSERPTMRNEIHRIGYVRVLQIVTTNKEYIFEVERVDKL